MHQTEIDFDILPIHCSRNIKYWYLFLSKKQKKCEQLAASARDTVWPICAQTIRTTKWEGDLKTDIK